MGDFDYERWATSMNDLADQLLTGFAERRGYPPGVNEVRRAPFSAPRRPAGNPADDAAYARKTQRPAGNPADDAAYARKTQRPAGNPADDAAYSRKSQPRRLEGNPEDVATLPAPLAEFFQHIDEVSLPDFHNGFFIPNARWTVGGMDGTQIVRIEGQHTTDVVTFAADGGGTHFALGLPEGAPVYQLPPGAVDRRGVYDDWDSRVRVVARTLPEFLAEVQEFFATRISEETS